jgi:sulfite exporter TauE/SafE
MTELLTALFGGLLGSAHCIGMCGGFVAIVGTSGQPGCSVASRQILYNLGRVFTYTFLGAGGGFAGGYLSRFDSAMISLQQAFSIGAGVFMILVGAAALGWIPWRRMLPANLTGRLAAFFGSWLRLPGKRGLFLGGVANGFLPCGLVYAFLALAVASGGSMRGMLIMLLFGLGTLPAMTLFGCGSAVVGHRLRSRILQVAAVLVMVTGGICIKRGLADRSRCCNAHQISTASETNNVMTSPNT